MNSLWQNLKKFARIANKGVVSGITFSISLQLYNYMQEIEQPKNESDYYTSIGKILGVFGIISSTAYIIKNKNNTKPRYDLFGFLVSIFLNKICPTPTIKSTIINTAGLTISTIASSITTSSKQEKETTLTIAP